MSAGEEIPDRDRTMAEGLSPARRELVDAVLDPDAAFAMSAEELAPL